VAFSVRAHNSAGWGPWSGPSPAVTPDIEPGRPASPAVQFADGALIVSWSPPANQGSAITNYDVQIGGGASAIQRIGATTTFRWEGLTNGQEYTFQVRAVNAKGEGEFSAPSAPEHPLRPPDAPPAPVGTRGDKTITVNWGAPANGGDRIIEYQVQILSTGASNTTTGTSIRWANLPNGQPQQFQVRARNRADWGAWSPASAAVVPCGVPDAPTNVAATRGDQSAAVTWSAPYDQGCAITGYTVRANGGGGTNVGGGVTSATVGGLSNGTTYTFTVVARNEVGDSAASAASNPVVPAGLPCAPNISSAAPDTGRVTVSWGAACPNGSAITQYQLATNGQWQNVGTGTSYTRTGLADGTTYSFQVRAVNDVGTGPGGNTVNARTPGPPNQVGGLDVAGGDRRITATWSAPNDNGKPITHYRVDGPGGVVQETGRSHTWTGLDYETSYSVRVQACNEVGCGEWSATRSATTEPAPRTITVSRGRSAVGQPGCGTPDCAFFHINASGMAPNTNYQVNCYGDDGSGMRQFDTGTSYVSSGSAGNINQDASCYWGYGGQPVYATLNGIRSSTNNSW
jgi:hypothetical protein